MVGSGVSYFRQARTSLISYASCKHCLLLQVCIPNAERLGNGHPYANNSHLLNNWSIKLVLACIYVVHVTVKLLLRLHLEKKKKEKKVGYPLYSKTLNLKCNLVNISITYPSSTVLCSLSTNLNSRLQITTGILAANSARPAHIHTHTIPH